MKKIIILFIFSILLFAKNPDVYAALGDVIYDNAPKIEKLKTITEYVSSPKEIDKYISDVEKTKKIGYKIESGDESIDKKSYLKSLRKLSKTNDYFVRHVYKVYKNALESEDSWLLSQMINSGLMDTKKYKKEIIEYYKTHSDIMDTSGVIQKYLDEDAKLRVKKNKPVGLTKEQMLKAKIKRLREKDRLKQEAIQKSLEEQVAKEKVKIRQEQVEELSQ